MLRLSVFDMVRILVLSMCIVVKKIDSESCSRNGYWVRSSSTGIRIEIQNRTVSKPELEPGIFWNRLVFILKVVFYCQHVTNQTLGSNLEAGTHYWPADLCHKHRTAVW